MNLIEELGLEKCKAIVDGAPRGAEKWRDMDSVCHSEEILYYAKGPHFWVVWDVEKKCWVVSVIHEGDEYILDQLQDLKDLRTAITTFDKEELEALSEQDDLFDQFEKEFFANQRIDDIAKHDSREFKVGDSHPLNIIALVEMAQSRQSEIDQLKVQLSLQRDRSKALETELTNSRNYGDSLHSQLNNMEQCYIDMKKERDELLDANTARDKESQTLRDDDDQYFLG